MNDDGRSDALLWAGVWPSGVGILRRLAINANFAADQAALAAQLQALGVGRKLDGQTATPGDIRTAVDELLSDRTAHDVATRLQRRIR